MRIPLTCGRVLLRPQRIVPARHRRGGGLRRSDRWGRRCARCAGTATCTTSGTTIWDWLDELNTVGFAGHSDWRIPTVGEDGGAAELETIFDGTAPGCGSSAPCVQPPFNTDCTDGCSVADCSCTQTNFYWSATNYAALSDGNEVWVVNFTFGVGYNIKTNGGFVRAVRN